MKTGNEDIVQYYPYGGIVTTSPGVVQVWFIHEPSEDDIVLEIIGPNRGTIDPDEISLKYYEDQKYWKRYLNDDNLKSDVNEFWILQFPYSFMDPARELCDPTNRNPSWGYIDLKYKVYNEDKTKSDEKVFRIEISEHRSLE